MAGFWEILEMHRFLFFLALHCAAFWSVPFLLLLGRASAC